MVRPPGGCAPMGPGGGTRQRSGHRRGRRRLGSHRRDAVEGRAPAGGALEDSAHARLTDTAWALGTLVVGVIVTAVWVVIGRRTPSRGAGLLALVLVLLACIFGALGILDLIGTAQCEDSIRDTGGDCEGHGIIFLFSGGLGVVLACIAMAVNGLSRRRY